MKYTTEEAAERLGIAVNTVQRQCKRGKIQATRFGRSWQIDEKEIDRYMRENKGRFGAPPGNKNAMKEKGDVRSG